MVGAIIPTWNCTRKFIRTFESIEPQVDKVLIVDNGSKANSLKLLSEIQDRYSDKLLIKYLESNTGTAHVYNVGLPILFEEGCNLILISDQDSFFEKNYVKSMLEARKKHGDIILGANIVDKNSGEGKKYEVFKKFWFYRTRKFQGGILFCSMVISSGTFLSKNIFEKVGKFNEDLFIACIEPDYGIRAKYEGIKCAAVENAQIRHEQGRARKVTPFLNSKQYSPFRLYNIGRSRMLCVRKYWQEFGFVIWLKLGILHHFFVVVILERNKLAKINALLKGSIDGLMNRKIRNF